MAGGNGQDQLDALDDIDDGEPVVMDGGDAGEDGGGKKGGGSDAGDAGEDLDIVIETGDGAQDGGEGAEGADGGEDGTQSDAGDDGKQADAGGGEEDDLKDVSKSVRSRIERERRIRREVEAERDQERVERAEADRQLRASRKFTTDLVIQNLEFQIKEAQGALKAAKEAGETDKEIEAQTKLNDLQGKRREAEGVKSRIETEEERAKQAGGDQARGARKPANPLTERWMGRNKWFKDEGFAVAAGTVRIIDAQMVREGFRPDSEAYFIELDKRIHREMPQLRSRIRQAGYGPKVDTGQRGRPQGGALPVRTQTQRSATASKTRVVLNQADFRNMERFGLDPKSRADQVAYARSKMEGKGS